uniref:Uncharacterized protein n=1 Tax=viral metagenome TaxID=1070528 RepID=A0A6C0BB61_9ZZZZ
MASPLLVPICLLTNQLSLNDLQALQAHVASLMTAEPVAIKAGEVVLVGENTYAHVGRPELGTFNVLPAAAEEKILTPNQLRQEVIKMADSKGKAFKAGWRKLVLNRGMVENVFGILEECYSEIRRKNSNPEGWKTARELGGRDTLKWQRFKLRVISYLYEKGSFGSPEEEEGFHDFEDTAGGCDEIAWDAACYLLEHPEWQAK